MLKHKFELKYKEPAIHDKENEFEYLTDSMNSSPSKILKNVNDDWERWSLPIGCGYFGANVFGRTDNERITVAEKTMNTSVIKGEAHLCGGLNTFADLHVIFNHQFDETKKYLRTLDIENAIATVKYDYHDTTYYREYFTSYPDKSLVMYFSSSKENELSFDFYPNIPFIEDYMYYPNDGHGKSGRVLGNIKDNVGCIEIQGKLETYNIDFCGLCRVYTDKGNTISIEKNENIKDHVYVKVRGANKAIIVLTLDTSYVLEPDVFTSKEDSKPTIHRTYKDAYDKVFKNIKNVEDLISNKGFDEKYRILKERHVQDYSNIYSRVSLDLDFNEEDFEKMTDELLFEYKEGKRSSYLEALYFQYGRYLLIASSREGTLPAHLQGTWNKYRQPMWTSGYWHNINVQMNYWPAFVTNLKETFPAYVEYNKAYLEKAKMFANEYVQSDNPSVYNKDGGNGWCIGIGCWPNKISGDRSAGNLGFTTQLFWEYYQFTKDKKILKEIVYPLLVEAARYITKCVKEDEEGNYLVQHCDSPEQYVDGVWFYTKGTTYAQTFAYLNNYHVLLCAKELGIDVQDDDFKTREEYEIVKTILNQIDKYDPIIVGLSGQIKEFRQEKYYGDLGEYTHRHISHLVGLYPGELISSRTPSWLDAAKVTLTNRGDKATGWGVAHRMNLWARCKDGDRTYQLVRQIIENNTATNLWDLHPPFQIDGNLGGTSGIAEMLLQSHEGYIHPIPALPSVWSKGEYKGMVARGNFIVDCLWDNCSIKELRIKSNCGEDCRIYVGNSTNVKIYNSKNEKIEYVLNDKIIEFKTLKDETYVITNFEHHNKVKTINNLTLEEKQDAIIVKWDDEIGYVYRVYISKESDPLYTYICETNINEYVYKKENDKRITIAITCVDEENNESDRRCVYVNN